MPFVRVELVVLAIRAGELQVLLARREEAPYRGYWGLPGGVLRIDLDATLDAAATRVGEKRLHHRFAHVQQVLATGGAKRDPRAPWAMSVIYVALAPADLKLTPGKRVQALEWHPVVAALSMAMAFDHAALIARALERVRAPVRALQFTAGWLPADFTIPELQGYCEAILGERLDKVTFRRRLQALAPLQAVEGKMRRTGAHRPARVFRLAIPGAAPAPVDQSVKKAGLPRRRQRA